MATNVKGILGEKLGMTQVWDDANRVVPVTVVKAGPCVVTQVRTPEVDGYEAVQIAYGAIDPRKCISFMTYFGREITPRELREPMGLYVYGCDRCQNVCPRNIPWMAEEKPTNPRVLAKAADFGLSGLLHMDKTYFEKKIWPHMFYVGADDIWRWKMNVARVMGNSLDPDYVDDLVRAFEENTDERVLGMIAWALGKLGGKRSKMALERFSSQAQGLVLDEIHAARDRIAESV